MDKTNMDPDTSIKAVFTSVEMKVKRKLENKENEEVTIVRKKMKVKINRILKILVIDGSDLMGRQ